MDNDQVKKSFNKISEFFFLFQIKPVFKLCQLMSWLTSKWEDERRNVGGTHHQTRIMIIVDHSGIRVKMSFSHQIYILFFIFQTTCTQDADPPGKLTTMFSFLRAIYKTNFWDCLEIKLSLFRNAQMCVGMVLTSKLSEAGVSKARLSSACWHQCWDPGHLVSQWQGVFHLHVHVLQCHVAREQVTSSI